MRLEHWAIRSLCRTAFATEDVCVSGTICSWEIGGFYTGWMDRDRRFDIRQTGGRAHCFESRRTSLKSPRTASWDWRFTAPTPTGPRDSSSTRRPGKCCTKKIGIHPGGLAVHVLAEITPCWSKWGQLLFHSSPPPGAEAGPQLTFAGKEPRKVTACARDGRVAVGFGDGTVDLIEAGRSVRTITPPAKAIGIDELLFTADGKLLMIRWGGSLVLWDMTSGAERFRATVQCGSLCSTAISQDASVIAIADDKKKVLCGTRE